MPHFRPKYSWQKGINSGGDATWKHYLFFFSFLFFFGAINATKSIPFSVVQTFLFAWVLPPPLAYRILLPAPICSSVHQPADTCVSSPYIYIYVHILRSEQCKLFVAIIIWITDNQTAKEWPNHDWDGRSALEHDRICSHKKWKVHAVTFCEPIRSMHLTKERRGSSCFRMTENAIELTKWKKKGGQCPGTGMKGCNFWRDIWSKRHFWLIDRLMN